MVHLEDHQAAVYLRGQYPALDAKQLIAIAGERGLSGFVRSPGGLDILARIDMVASPPESLTEVFERVVSAIGMLRGADHGLVAAGSPEPEVLTSAAQRLASASVVCQLVNIEMPEATLAIPETALSARLIAFPMLHEAGIKALLSSQLFIDAGSHHVKVYPNELAPFLAAEQTAARQALEVAQTLMPATPRKSRRNSPGGGAVSLAAANPVAGPPPEGASPRAPRLSDVVRP
jgi:hypothetical protein